MAIILFVILKRKAARNKTSEQHVVFGINNKYIERGVLRK